MKTLVIKILISTILITTPFIFCSCSRQDTPDDNKGDYSENEHPNTNNESNSTNEEDVENVFKITTTSSTDDYGLAGTYTMLYNKPFKTGQAVTLETTVNEGYNFEGWFIDNVCLSKQLTFTYTVQNRDVVIQPLYSYYTVSTFSNQPAANVAGIYTKMYEEKVSFGETVTLSATVNDGYNFEGWFIDGVCVSRNLDYSYNMEKENVEIYAEYSSYQLTVIGASYNDSGKRENYFDAGTYTQHSNENISAGTPITLTATVKDGYNFVGWYVDGTCVSSDLAYNFVMGKENINIEATYFYYTLSTTAFFRTSNYAYVEFDSPSLYINPKYEDEKISVGKEVTVVATDIEGYTFYCWKTSDSILCTEKTYTFTMPTNDVSIYALYVEQE